MSRRVAGIVVASLSVAALAGCGGTKTVTVTQTVTATVTETTTVQVPAAASACSGRDLGGSFSEVPGSAGAGSITYVLTLTNTSPADCFVSGMPQLLLLGAEGRELPTTATAAQPGRATAAKIVLHPGDSATADARFSPDIPGPGEPASAPSPGRPQTCEPTARELQVTLGEGSVTVAVRPPTPVCSHGALSMSLFTAA